MIQAGLPTATFSLDPAARPGGPLGGEGRQLADRARGRSASWRAITPWNYPLHQIANKVAPALAAGCTVVLKPSEVAPLNAFVLAEIIEEVGLPAGVFNLVTGTGPVVGEALVAHPDDRTWSRSPARPAPGKRVSELAAQSVKPRDPRARRQVAERDPRRRRPRARGDRRRGQVLPQLGPDVQRADAHARAARQAGGGGADRGEPRPRRSRPATRSTTTSRLGPLVSATQLERVRGYIEKGDRRGRPARDRRRRAARGPRAGLLRGARPSSPTSIRR